MREERMTEREPNGPVVLDPFEETVILRLDSMGGGRGAWVLDGPLFRASRLVKGD